MRGRFFAFENETFTPLRCSCHGRGITPIILKSIQFEFVYGRDSGF
jgi:hypothetical protein